MYGTHNIMRPRSKKAATIPVSLSLAVVACSTGKSVTISGHVLFQLLCQILASTREITLPQSFGTLLRHMMLQSHDSNCQPR